jgi:hypothetical protein
MAFIRSAGGHALDVSAPPPGEASGTRFAAYPQASMGILGPGNRSSHI